VAPWPPQLVEHWYSAGFYPSLQKQVTSFSNRAPIAVLDLFGLLALGTWVVDVLVQLVRGRRDGARRALVWIIGRTAVAAAALYLLFLLTWGLNYRRPPLIEKLKFDPSMVTREGAEALTWTVVSRLNALHARAHRGGWPDAAVVDESLAAAFADAERTLGGSGRTLVGRPKRSLLDIYFRRAAVDGMIDPFFLETLVVSNLLPFERPFVVAHEWGHLAGFADEGEANVVGWLAAIRASPPSQYSGWLFLWNELMGQTAPADRAEFAKQLDDGPRSDLRAIAERNAKEISPAVSAAGRRVYDRYLKASGVKEGMASYATVVRLLLGLRLVPRAGDEPVTSPPARRGAKE
jgi:hypothetical protein